MWHEQWECLRAWLLLGFPRTAPPSVCVPGVIGALAVWIPNPQKNKNKCVCHSFHGPLREYLRARRFRATCYCTPPVCVPAVLGALTVWRQNTIELANRSSNNLLPRGTKVSAIDVTSKVFFDRLYWFQDWLYLSSESTVCVLPHPHCSCNNYLSISVHFFSHFWSAHDSPSNLAESRYPRPRSDNHLT